MNTQSDTENMTNSMIIEYLYEQIEDLDDFLYGEACKHFDVQRFMGMAEEIVKLHVDFINKEKSL